MSDIEIRYPPEALEELADFFRSMAHAHTIDTIKSDLLANAEKLEARAKRQRGEFRSDIQYGTDKMMADETSQTGRLHPERINVDVPDEVEGWSKKFGVTHQRLIEAVQAVGDVAGDVEGYLAKSRDVAADPRPSTKEL